jgi:hypothetical protein
MAKDSRAVPVPSRTTLLVLWILSLLPAAGLVGLVVRNDARKADFLSRARGRADGTVIRLIEQRGKHIQFHPVVAFTTADGRHLEFKSIYSDYLAFGEKHYPLGGRVAVAYVAKDSGPFVVGGGIYAGFMTLVFGLVALLTKKKGPDSSLPAEPLAPS